MNSKPVRTVNAGSLFDSHHANSMFDEEKTNTVHVSSTTIANTKKKDDARQEKTLSLKSFWFGSLTETKTSSSTYTARQHQFSIHDDYTQVTQIEQSDANTWCNVR